MQTLSPVCTALAGITKIPHTLAAMGSAALAATVWPPYPCEVTPVSPLGIMKR